MRVALVGNPNVGKTTLFNALTGAHRDVANWPGTTVGLATGMARRAGLPAEIVDLPGTYAIGASSEEERVTRDFVLREPWDAIVAVVDASRLERGLYLVLELLSLTPRVVVALSMADVARRAGLRIDAVALGRALGVEVVPAPGTRGQGLGALLEAARDAARRTAGAPPADLPQPLARDVLLPLADRLRALGPDLPYPALWAAQAMAGGDHDVLRTVRGLPGGAGIAAFAQELGRAWVAQAGAGVGDAGWQEEAALTLADHRYARVAALIAACVRGTAGHRRRLQARLDDLFLHPVLGYALMGAIFGAAFWLTFSASAPATAYIGQAIAALGRAGPGFLRAIGAPPLLRGLLLDGVLPGVGAVVAFAPYLAAFFLVYGILQDSGYLARASLLADRFLQAIGLHGKGFFALVSAYGCNVPALSATRAIESPRERLLLNLVIPFIPCSARLGTMALITAAFFPGPTGAAVMVGLVAISGVTLAGVTALYRLTCLRAEAAPLVFELPDYRWPAAGPLLGAAFHRVWGFLSRVALYLLWASALIWALLHLPVGAAPDATWAARLGRALGWAVGRHLGLDGRLMLALLFGFAAKETTLSSLGVLFGAGGTALGRQLALALTPRAAFTFLVVYMLYVPCIATLVQMRRESGGWTYAALGAGVQVAVALAVGLGVAHALLWFGVLG